MQVIDLAIEKELEARQTYTELSQRTQDVGLKTILELLADAEEQHYQKLCDLKDARAVTAEASDAFLTKVRALFTKLDPQAGKSEFTIAEVDLYKLARQREEENRDIYAQAAEASESPQARQLFAWLAEEEKDHFAILDSLVDFVGHAEPGHWLEDAEWYHRDQY